jgi:hypothetical protein
MANTGWSERFHGGWQGRCSVDANVDASPLNCGSRYVWLPLPVKGTGAVAARRVYAQPTSFTCPRPHARPPHASNAKHGHARAPLLLSLLSFFVFCIAMVLSKFDSLSVRPPTPPKNPEDELPAADATLQFLDDPFGEKPALPKVVTATKRLLNTPDQSPSSDISIPSSAASRQKRVNFELQICAISPKKAAAHSWTPSRSSPLRSLPQTRALGPLRSILKPSDPANTPPPADEGAAPHKFKTLAEMLESIVKQLASAERPSRIDAYLVLQRTMQAYDKFPEDQSLKQKMSLLTQFIRRDAQAPSAKGDGLDSQLVSQALKMLMTLLRIPDATAAMDDDFCAFIVDRAVQVASDTTMPKVVVNTHLAVLMQQTFKPRIMTVARAEKILDMLDTIYPRISGLSVQAYRIRIYRKLIQQRPDTMIKHTRRWFELILRAFLSSQKDIYQSALDTALSAAKTLGRDPSVATSCLAVLNRTRSSGETVASLTIRELEKMLDSDNAMLVPQIWAAVTVLLRESLTVEAFTTLKEWLHVFQKCITSDKDSVRLHTNVAFGFFVYAINLSNDSAASYRKMFMRIPQHQIQGRVLTKKTDRDAVASGYLTLLYYAFRPTAPPEQWDLFWREFIVAFWTPLLKSSTSPSSHAIAACRIVSALLNGVRKPWNEQRALDYRPQCMVQRGDLPVLDPRWLRKSLALVLPFVDTLLDATPWSENDQQEDESARAMWVAVLDSLVEASSKEVMASSETKDAMAQVINLLRRVWDRHTAQLAVSQQKEDIWASKFCFMVETAVQKLGATRFVDKCLTRNSADEFEVASTPSHRSKQHGAQISPLLYLVDLLVNQSEGKLPDAVRLRATKLILEPSFISQTTRLGKLELLRDCVVAIDVSLKAAVALNLWPHIATLLQTSLREQTSNSDEPASRPLGKEYELVVDLLGLGSTYFFNKPRGHDVLSAFIDRVRQESGDGAVVLAVIEKVSELMTKSVANMDTSSCLAYTSILLRNLPKQTSRRHLEESRQILWPSSQAARRQNDIDPYNHLYSAIASIGGAAYRDIGSADLELSTEFLAAMAFSIKSCSPSHLTVYLRKTQEVVQRWVEDPDRKMQSAEQPLKSLHRQVCRITTEALNLLILSRL